MSAPRDHGATRPWRPTRPTARSSASEASATAWAGSRSPMRACETTEDGRCGAHRDLLAHDGASDRFERTKRPDGSSRWRGRSVRLGRSRMPWPDGRPERIGRRHGLGGSGGSRAFPLRPGRTESGQRRAGSRAVLDLPGMGSSASIHEACRNSRRLGLPRQAGLQPHGVTSRYPVRSTRTRRHDMALTLGILALVEAKPGKEAEVEAFVKAGQGDRRAGAGHPRLVWLPRRRLDVRDLRCLRGRRRRVRRTCPGRSRRRWPPPARSCLPRIPDIRLVDVLAVKGA